MAESLHSSPCAQAALPSCCIGLMAAKGRRASSRPALLPTTAVSLLENQRPGEGIVLARGKDRPSQPHPLPCLLVPCSSTLCCVQPCPSKGTLPGFLPASTNVPSAQNSQPVRHVTGVQPSVSGDFSGRLEMSKQRQDLWGAPEPHPFYLTSCVFYHICVTDTEMRRACISCLQESPLTNETGSPRTFLYPTVKRPLG